MKHPVHRAEHECAQILFVRVAHFRAKEMVRATRTRGTPSQTRLFSLSRTGWNACAVDTMFSAG